MMNPADPDLIGGAPLDVETEPPRQRGRGDSIPRPGLILRRRSRKFEWLV